MTQDETYLHDVAYFFRISFTNP